MLTWSGASMKQRATAQECMDAKGADPEKLINTIRQFRLINPLFTAARNLLDRHILRDMARFPDRTHHIMDLGAGGGDLAMWLVRQCRKRKFAVRMTCLDTNPLVTEFAKKQCAGYPEISVRLGSVFDLQRHPRPDYIVANHLLHHLTDEQISAVLALAADCAGRRVLFNDVRRSRRAYWGYWLFSRLFLYRSFAGVDGCLSIRRGFLKPELEKLLPGGKQPMTMEVKYANPFRVYVLGKKDYAD